MLFKALDVALRADKHDLYKVTVLFVFKARGLFACADRAADNGGMLFGIVGESFKAAFNAAVRFA